MRGYLRHPTDLGDGSLKLYKLLQDMPKCTTKILDSGQDLLLALLRTPPIAWKSKKQVKVVTAQFRKNRECFNESLGRHTAADEPRFMNSPNSSGAYFFTIFAAAASGLNSSVGRVWL